MEGFTYGLVAIFKEIFDHKERFRLDYFILN